MFEAFTPAVLDLPDVVIGNYVNLLDVGVYVPGPVTPFIEELATETARTIEAMTSMPIHLQPTLIGEILTLRPLHSDDFEALHAAASDPLIWEQHPDPLRHQRERFEKFFGSAIASKGAFAVIENRSGTIIGTSRYYEWMPGGKEISIGYTFLARSHWGGPANREMKHLMLDHISQWADVVWFHVGVENRRSRKAVEKLGATLDHIEPREVNGLLHDYACYRIIPVRPT